jgi:hypothetical protein
MLKRFLANEGDTLNNQATFSIVCDCMYKRLILRNMKVGMQK